MKHETIEYGCELLISLKRNTSNDIFISKKYLKEKNYLYHYLRFSKVYSCISNSHWPRPHCTLCMMVLLLVIIIISSSLKLYLNYVGSAIWILFLHYDYESNSHIICTSYLFSLPLFFFPNGPINTYIASKSSQMDCP